MKRSEVRVLLGIFSGATFIVANCLGCALKVDYGANRSLVASGTSVTDSSGNSSGNPSENPPANPTPPSEPPPIKNELVVSYAPADQKLSAGSNLLLSVGVKSQLGLPVNYQWSKDGTVLTGQIGDSFVIAKVSKSDTGTYSCAVKDLVGSITVQAAVEVNPGQGQGQQ
jgi:hypothetical protein